MSIPSTDTSPYSLATLASDATESEEKISTEEYERREKAIKGTEERFLYGENSDEEGWRSEALAVIDDIRGFVSNISISSSLPCDNNGIYINLETNESIRLTIELSSAGFRICGKDFDTIIDNNNNAKDKNNDEQQQQQQQHLINCGNNVIVSTNSYYETPYSLLDTISPSYRNSFSKQLAQKLMELCK